MQYRYWIRLILITTAVVSLGNFAFQYINPSGQLLVAYDFCQAETPYFSGLSPHGRVLDLDRQRCQQQMVIDPVYFDVRLPQSYRTAVISLDADIPDEQLLVIGVGIDPDNWQWEFAELSDNGHYLLDLSNAKFDNNRYRFIISTPELDISNQEVLFKSLKLSFTKESLNSTNFWERWRNIIN